LDFEKQIYDLIIIGGGPAGLSAGIYASRSGLKTLILEEVELGGRAAQTSLYENFPGFPDGIMGKELVERMERQALKSGAIIKHFEKAKDLDVRGKLKTVLTSNATYQSCALIIATGTQRRKLQVSGENELIGRGVSYCQVCDAPFFKGLRVAVVGFTREAILDSMALAGIAKEVLLITQAERFEVSEELKRRLLEKGNVKIVNGKVVAIKGENIVKAVRIVVTETKEEIQEEVNGVFVSLGKAPATELVSNAGIEVDDKGCIVVNRWQRTNVEGVFAAGDCTCGGMQVVTAIGEGAMAAMKVSLNKKNT
jgi:thioredoxin reductase (NADPH)